MGRETVRCSARRDSLNRPSPRGSAAGLRLLSRLASTRHLPLHRGFYALALTTGANAALGLLFWVAAARLYPTHIVGLGAAGVSAVQLVAIVGWLGLEVTLIRYLPVAGPRRRRLLALVYAAGGGAALVTAGVFALFVAGALEVPYVVSNSAAVVAFFGSVLIWVVFSLQDAALVGIRRAPLVPVENTIYAAVKLVLLVALSAVAEPWTILGVWFAPAAVATVIVNGLLFRRLLSVQGREHSLPTATAVARFSVGHTAVAVTGSLPDFLVPLLVLRFLGQDANAYYYAAWAIGASVRLLSFNLANVLVAEAAYAEIAIGRLLRSATRLSFLFLVPVLLMLLLGASAVLRLFGAEYASEAAPLLRYLALSIVPFTVAAFAVALDRIRERFAAALTITGVGSATVIGLNLVLLPSLGITGAGIAWLAGQGAAAVVAIAIVRLPLPSDTAGRPTRTSG